MRVFQQSIALLMLVLFAPASMHCLIAAPTTGDCAAVAGQACAAPDSGSEHSCPEETSHGCPASTLAKTSVPTGISVPAMPTAALEDMLVALQRMVEQVLLNSVALGAAPEVAPKELQTTWAFKARAALPARWPSELV